MQITISKSDFITRGHPVREISGLTGMEQYGAGAPRFTQIYYLQHMCR